MVGATYIETLDAFTNFVTAYVHTLLFLRSLYPQTSFVHSRFHNTSVYQSRHPSVCDWIRGAVDAVRSELLAGTVSRIGIVIFHYENEGKSGSAQRTRGDVQIMERFMVDVSAFPAADKDERNAVQELGSRPPLQTSAGSASNRLEGSGGDDQDCCHDKDEAGLSDADTSSRSDRNREGNEPNEPAFDLGVDTNLAEQMRAVLISLTSHCAQLKPLPDKCTFIIAMELKDKANVDPSLGHPQAWTPVQPSEHEIFRHAAAERRGALRFTPIRTVETGTLRFKTWVEEGWAKFETGGKEKDSFLTSMTR